MVPQALILTAGLVAMTAAPAAASAHEYAVSLARADAAAASPAPGEPVRVRHLPGRAVRGLGYALGTASTSSVLALWAATMVALGAAPMAIATMHRSPVPVIVSGHATPDSTRSP
jgi:hypothetical protein